MDSPDYFAATPKNESFEDFYTFQAMCLAENS